MRARRVASKLLEIQDGKALLNDAALASLRVLAKLSVIVFMGDGRVGKSFLADRFAQSLGSPAGTFPSLPQQKPVTEGIDYVVIPRDEGALVILDCEGVNNAQGPIREAVSVLGMASAQQVVYVVGSQASEPQLETLGRIAASRQLLGGGGDFTAQALAALPPPTLQFVVNKKDPFLDAQDLETMLAEQEDPGRNELRAMIKGAFGQRRLFNVPLEYSADADITARIELQNALLEKAAEPFCIAGVPATGQDLVRLLRSALQPTEVRMPSVIRGVVYDGFLLPLAQGLLEEYTRQLPPLSDTFRPSLPARADAATVQRLRQRAAHIKQSSFIDEAAQWLSLRMSEKWQALVAQNNAIGHQVQSTVSETRQTLIDTYQKCVGKGKRRLGPRKKYYVTVHRYRIDARSIVTHKNGQVFAGEWVPTSQIVEV